MDIILLKNIPLHISNQANKKGRGLFWRDRNSNFSFMASKMLFEQHLPELRALIKWIHKRHDLQDRLHGVGTHNLLWWCSHPTPGGWKVGRIRGFFHVHLHMQSISCQPGIQYYDNFFKSSPGSKSDSIRWCRKKQEQKRIFHTADGNVIWHNHSGKAWRYLLELMIYILMIQQFDS